MYKRQVWNTDPKKTPELIFAEGTYRFLDAEEISHEVYSFGVGCGCLLYTSLLGFLQGLVREDPVPTKVVDMTALHLVELTRKKIRRPLAEQMK